MENSVIFLPSCLPKWLFQHALKDDDLRFLPDDFQPLLPRHDLINDRIIAKFIPAYILLRDAASENPRKDIPFKLNEDCGFTSSFDDAQDLQDSEGYWAHLVVSAYQGPWEDDGDPVEELLGKSPKLGRTFNYDSVLTAHWYHSAVFLEAIRDSQPHPDQMEDPDPIVSAHWQQWFRSDVDGVVAHEIGHGPSKIDGIEHHNEGGLMASGSGQIDKYGFRPKTIKRFRVTKSWLDIP